MREAVIVSTARTPIGKHSEVLLMTLKRKRWLVML